MIALFPPTYYLREVELTDGKTYMASTPTQIYPSGQKALFKWVGSMEFDPHYTFLPKLPEPIDEQEVMSIRYWISVLAHDNPNALRLGLPPEAVVQEYVHEFKHKTTMLVNGIWPWGHRKLWSQHRTLEGMPTFQFADWRYFQFTD